MKNSIFLFFILVCAQAASQKSLIEYNEANQIANIHYNENLFSSYTERDKTQKTYPSTGTYAPRYYANTGIGIDPGVGACNYIYIPTNKKLQPGIQYNLQFTIKMEEAYQDQVYFQQHFGIALTSSLFCNKWNLVRDKARRCPYWGLWRHSMHPIKISETGQLVKIEIEFRPLCESKYIVLGVFQGHEMDKQGCGFCEYDFELHELSIEKSTNLDSDFVYFCDGFEESEQRKINQNYSVYFDVGSSDIDPKFHSMLDSVSKNLVHDKDLIVLKAFTDINGNDNERLGANRNESVYNELIRRGIDGSRIHRINYSDVWSTDIVRETDRRVEISISQGALYKKVYEEAKLAATQENYAEADRLLRTEWIEQVPANMALMATYDCWGSSEKSAFFVSQLRSRIKTKFYRGNDLKFKLDSLNYESIKESYLTANLKLLEMPGLKEGCYFDFDASRRQRIRNEIDQIYRDKGFPSKDKVGSIVNVMPRVILTSDNLEYLESYLPAIRKACADKILHWRYYAKLYDKISLIKNGHQKYGTATTYDVDSRLIFRGPIKDIDSLAEFRKQVKLYPYSSKDIESIAVSQRDLNWALITELNSIYQSDQLWRNQLNEKKFEQDSSTDTLSKYHDQIAAQDSINLSKVTLLIDSNGWLGIEEVGYLGNQTLFLVIQHADLQTQQQYLPILRKAVSNGKASALDLAYLEDRIAVAKGEKIMCLRYLTLNKSIQDGKISDSVL